MLFDLNGNVITHGSYIAHDIDEVLTPQDMIIWRCASCQTYLLPREVGIMKRRVKDTLNNVYTWQIVQVCPACHPNPKEDMINEFGDAESDCFYKMSRFDYEEMRKRESSRIIVAN